MATVRKRPGRSTFVYRVRLPSGEWREFGSGLRDKRAAEQMAADHQKRIDRGEAGLLDPFEAMRTTPLAEFVADFLESRRAKNRAPRYVAGLGDRLTFAFESMPARFLPDATAQRVEDFLGRLLRGEGLTPMRARSAKGKPIERRAVSMRTRDGFVEALRAFGEWLHESDRWGSNPFGKLRKEARESDQTMQHRAFDVEELCKLVEAAEVRGPSAYRRVHPNADAAKLDALAAEGWARGTLYLFAAYCGLRSNECAELRWADVVLDGDDAHVVVRAEHAKNRTEQRVPLLPWVVERLREHRRRAGVAALRAGGRIPDGAALVFSIRRGLMASLRKDARWAGLGDHDAQGRRTTFHGLRASTATLLARAGVSPAVAMLVLRHTDPRLTLRTYAKLNGGDVRAELVAKLAPPRIASTQASTWSAPERAAVGCSVPLAEIGSAIADRLAGQERSGFAPVGDASCRSVPMPAQEGETGGRYRSRTCDPQLVELML